MVRYKVKFNNEGKVCPTSIEQLKRNPECGVYFYEEKPFNPHNKPPRKNPYINIDRNFTIDVFGNHIPPQPERPTPEFPRNRGLTIGQQQSPFISEQLDQDETNVIIQGKRGVLENLQYRRTGGYVAVPVNNDISEPVEDLNSIQYTNQEADHITQNVVSELDDLIQEAGIELPDLRPRQEGEIIQSRVIAEPPPSPPGEAGPSRDITEEELTEIQMEDIKARQRSKGVLSRKLPDLEEIVVISPAREEELILRAAENFTSKDKPKLTFNDVKKILNKLVPKMVAPERAYDVLNDNNLYDAYYENEYMKIRAEDRQFLRIFAKQNEARAQEIELQDTNLVPEEATAPFEPLEIEEYTGLVDRPGTGFEPRTRGKVQKEITKRAGKLPSELGELVRNIAPPSVDRSTTFDEEFIGEFRQVQLTETVRPSLSLGERLNIARTSTTRAEVGKAGAGLGVGLAAGYATSELFKNIGIDNPALIGLGTGAAAGGLTGLTTYGLERAAGKIATGATRSALTGAVEGGILGLATVPADMALNSYLVKKQGMSHTAANVISTTATAGTLTGVIIGAALAGAPESGGASIIAGVAALGVAEIIGLFTGLSEDKKEKEREQEINTIKQTNYARSKLLATLPRYNYSYTKAFKAFRNKDQLGMDRSDWKPFMMNAFRTFNPSDWSNQKLPASDQSKEPSGDDKILAHLMSRYITRKVIERTCANIICSEETKRNTPKELSKEDIKWLDDKTAKTWSAIAQTTIEQAYHENNLTNKRSQTARDIVMNRWSQSKELPESLDPKLLAYANLDGKWLDAYKNHINGEAENIAIDAYNNNQTKIADLPKSIRDALAYNADSVVSLNNYYKHIEEASKAINVSPAQFINLQKTPYYEQKKLYEKYQFESKQQDSDAVIEAGKIATMEDKVKRGGYYDVDIAILKTDPNSITSFRPTDTQIFQAHSVGMTLQEYYNYMHELAKGEDGDFSNLPTLTGAERSRLGFDDWREFQEEVELAGQDPNAYQYNYQTQVISLKPITSIPVNNPDPVTEQPRELSEVPEEASLPASFLPTLNVSIDRVAQAQANIEASRNEARQNEININNIDTNLNTNLNEGLQLNPSVVIAVA